MELKEVRKNLLAQHESLRRLLSDLEATMERGAVFAPQLKALRDGLVAHNAAEEAVLLPILATIDAWGKERVEGMLAEHHEEHGLMVRKMEPGTAEATVREMIAELRHHMKHEEETILAEKLLRDDVVVADCDSE